MKGFFIEILEDFVRSKLGKNVWETTVLELKLPQLKSFESYPDELLINLLESLIKNSNSNKERFLFDFGRHFAKSPSVQKLYSEAFHKVTAREFLLDVKNIHHDVAKTVPGSRPPALIMEKPAYDELKIYYSSNRRFCTFLKGIIQGASESFREKILLSEETCMDKGDPRCEINIKFLSI